MFSARPGRPGNTPIYSPFGAFVVEQRDSGWLRRYLDDLPRPDLSFGEDHPLAQCTQSKEEDK